MRVATRWILPGIIVFIVSYAGFLITDLPAQQVTQRINRRLSNEHLPIKLVQPSGSVWTGRAVVLDQAQRVGRLDWSLAPIALIGGKVRSKLRLTGKDLALDGQLVMDSKLTVLKDFSGRTSVSWLAHTSNLPDSLHGQVQLNFKQLRIDAMRHLVYADGRIQILKARLPRLHLQLGTVQLQLTTHQHRIEGYLSNHGGDLSLRGELELYANSRYVLHLRMKPTDAQIKSRLGSGMSGLFGMADPSGWYHYNSSGRF